MTKQQMIDWLTAHGYEPQKGVAGAYIKMTQAGMKRYRLQDKSVRMEQRARICGKNEWIRIRSGYYGQLSITAEGLLAGMKR